MSKPLVAVAVFALLVPASWAADAAKPAKNQMVRGTIKQVEPTKLLLVVEQKLKDGTVERQLSITPDTEFVVSIGPETKTASGKEGLYLIEGKEGATIAVKCDKDVNVLKITVTAKK